MNLRKRIGRVAFSLIVAITVMASASQQARAGVPVSGRHDPTTADGAYRSLREAEAAGGVSKRLERQIARDGSAAAIVVFDASRISSALVSPTLHSSSRTMLSASRAAFAAVKAVAFEGLDQIDIVEPLEYLPMSIVRLRDEESLLALANTPGIIGVVAPQKGKANLAQSLPQIGANATRSAGYDGRGTYVAVLDTGVNYTQQAFGCSALGTPSTCQVVASYDTAPNDYSLDDSGHGTNVAGIVAGVAPGTGILSYDVFAGTSTDETYIFPAINDVLAKKAAGWNIRAVNMSLGNYYTYFNGPCATMPGSTVVNPYIDSFSRLRAAGILPVVASGNTAWGDAKNRFATFQNGIQYPACTPGALSVGAVWDAALGYQNVDVFNCHDTTTAADQVTCFSQSGSTLSILAPGCWIVAAGQTYCGTSQAAPHVAGAVAVLAAARPSASATGIEQALVGTGPVIYDPRSGYSDRRLDVVAALNALSPADTTPPIVTAPVQQIAGGTVGTTVPVTISWSASDTSGIASYQLFVSKNGGGWVQKTEVPSAATSFTFWFTPGVSYQYYVRAYDTAGNAGVSAAGPVFTPTVIDDRSTAISYYGAAGSTTLTWSYSAWNLAYGTTLTASSRAGEYARYTFTGRDVAWVASLGNNRGKAKVFIDGVLFKTVVLYQTTGAGARIAVAKHWSTSGTHTIDVQTITASGYPTLIDVDAFVVIR